MMNKRKRTALANAVKASANDSRFRESLEDFCGSGYAGHPGPIFPTTSSTTFSNALISWIDKPLGATNDPEEKVRLLEDLANDLARGSTKTARSVAEDIHQAITDSDYGADAIEL